MWWQATWCVCHVYVCACCVVCNNLPSNEAVDDVGQHARCAQLQQPCLRVQVCSSRDQQCIPKTSRAAAVTLSLLALGPRGGCAARWLHRTSPHNTG